MRASTQSCDNGCNECANDVGARVSPMLVCKLRTYAAVHRGLHKPTRLFLLTSPACLHFSLSLRFLTCTCWLCGRAGLFFAPQFHGYEVACSCSRAAQRSSLPLRTSFYRRSACNGCALFHHDQSTAFREPARRLCARSEGPAHFSDFLCFACPPVVLCTYVFSIFAHTRTHAHTHTRMHAHERTKNVLERGSWTRIVNSLERFAVFYAPTSLDM